MNKKDLSNAFDVIKDILTLVNEGNISRIKSTFYSIIIGPDKISVYYPSKDSNKRPRLTVSTGQEVADCLEVIWDEKMDYSFDEFLKVIKKGNENE